MGTQTTPAPVAAPPPSLDAPLPGAQAALILLLAINLFNYIDRQVLAAVLPKIEATFLPDHPNAKELLGWLTTAFLLSYMLLAPVFGWLADRMSRWVLVGVAVGLWSLASGASGLALTYTLLLITRCFVGVGEAAYGPVAPSMISDLYPVKVRGSVLAWFYVAIPVGGALGYVLGGLVADSDLGWRWAFYLVVPPGLLLALCCFWMREPPRGRADAVEKAAGLKAGWRDYLVLAKTPSYVLNTLGMTAMTFTVGGIAIWMPTYIYEREARFQLTPAVFQELGQGSKAVPQEVLDKLKPLQGKEFTRVKDFKRQLQKRLTPAEMTRHEKRLLDEPRDLKLGTINQYFGAIVVVSGLLATLLGGVAGDWLRGRFPGSYFLVSGVAMLIAFPLVFIIPYVAFPLAWGLIFVAVFCLFFNTGPTNTILANVTHPSVRATGFALNILVIHVFGDAISPVIIGMITDANHGDMNPALQLVSLVILVGGGLWLWGARYLARDTALAPTRLASPA
jgi:MFS family permease